MSMSYYYLRAPFTSVRLEHIGEHDKVTLWENGANAGTLTLSKGVGRKFLYMMTDHVDDSQAPMRIYWGDSDKGCVVTENVRGLDPDLMLISEYGEPLRVSEIRDRAGHVRKDKMPGELFGYDEAKP